MGHILLEAIQKCMENNKVTGDNQDDSIKGKLCPKIFMFYDRATALVDERKAGECLFTRACRNRKFVNGFKLKKGTY